MKNSVSPAAECQISHPSTTLKSALRSASTRPIAGERQKQSRAQVSLLEPKRDHGCDGEAMPARDAPARALGGGPDVCSRRAASILRPSLRADHFPPTATCASASLQDGLRSACRSPSADGRWRRSASSTGSAAARRPRAAEHGLPFAPGYEAGYSAEDGSQDCLVGTGRRQMQPDLGFHLDDARGDLDQAQAQRVELRDTPHSSASASRCAGPTSASRRRRAGTGGTGWRWPCVQEVRSAARCVFQDLM